MGRTVSRILVVLLLIAFCAGYAQADEGKRVTIEVIDAPEDDPSVTGDLKEDIWFIAPSAGYVRITLDDVEINATRVEYYGKERRAIITGAVQVIQGENTITAEQVEALFDEERYIITGNVHLVQRKADSGEIRVELKAGYLEYFAAEDRIVAQDDVFFYNQDQEGRADRVTYLEEEGVVTLSGNARLITEQGTWWGNSFTIDLDNETVVGTGPGRLDLTL